MGYSVMDSEGVGVMGDRELTPYLKEQADKIDGWVQNDETGEKVYPLEEDDGGE